MDLRDQCLRVIGDEERPSIERQAAAKGLAEILLLHPPDERLLAELVAVVTQCRGSIDVVAPLVMALGLATRDPLEAVADLETLLDLALSEGNGDLAAEVLSVMLKVAVLAPRVEPGWVKATLRLVMPDQRYSVWAATLVDEWIDLTGDVPPWADGAVRRCPEILEGMSLDSFLRAHRSAPTVEGWLLLVRMSTFHGDLDPRPGDFGKRAVEALATMEEALRRGEDENLPVEKSWLACWRRRWHRDPDGPVRSIDAHELAAERDRLRRLKRYLERELADAIAATSRCGPRRRRIS